MLNLFSLQSVVLMTAFIFSSSCAPNRCVLYFSSCLSLSVCIYFNLLIAAPKTIRFLTLIPCFTQSFISSYIVQNFGFKFHGFIRHVHVSFLRYALALSASNVNTNSISLLIFICLQILILLFRSMLDVDRVIVLVVIGIARNLVGFIGKLMIWTTYVQ